MASYIIIGAGVFGASTAYHLSQSDPEASITLLDRSASFPCPVAASYDYNKICRADYTNKFYCELALEALESWTNDPLFKPYFHRTGMAIADYSGRGSKIIENYKTLEAPEPIIIVPDEMRKRYDGAFEDANFEGCKGIFVNPLSGWAEATAAVTEVIESAIKSGVKYVQGDIEALVFDDSGASIGVRTKDGTVFSADKTILCTGPSTARLLANSAPERAELQSGDRITAAGVVTGCFKLSRAQQERFKKLPVFVHESGGVRGEVIPTTRDGLLKICVDNSFKNTALHAKSGQYISAPPDEPDQAQHVVSKLLQNEVRIAARGIFGKELENVSFESFRICWDGITPNQDFIISAHPHCRNLYVATGGSFHGWKFLPIVGKYVVQLLDGTLDTGKLERWAWDRDNAGSAHANLIPKREIKDLL